MPNLQLAGIAVAALLAWLLLLQVAVWATRPSDVRPGPESLDLGPEPPAVANLLAGGWRMTPDATSATLIDLAARGVLAFEQHGPDAERTVCRLREAPTGLTAYERRVYNRVTALAEGGVVPAAALVRGDAKWAKSWWRDFRKETITDAQVRGLTRDRWSKPVLTLLHTAALAPALLAAVTVLTGRTTGKNGEPERPLAVALGAGVVLWWALAALVRWFSDQRDTPAGRVAAARWLGYRDHVARDESFAGLPPAAVAIWDRHLAYAAALGIAKTAVRVLPLGARSERLAWSAYGGSWHRIRVRYPRGLWGASPWQVAFRGLLQVLVAGAAAYLLLKLRAAAAGDLDQLEADLARWAWVLQVPLVVAILVILRGAWNLLRAIAEYPSRHPVQGEVIRLVARSTGDSDNPSYLFYAGIDDGRSTKTRAYLLSSTQYHQLDEGDEVRLLTGRYLHRVFDVTVLKEEAPPPDTEAVPTMPAQYRSSSAPSPPPAPAFGGMALVAGALGLGSQPAGSQPAAGADVGAAGATGATGAGGSADAGVAPVGDPRVTPTSVVTAEDVAGVLGVPVTAQPVGPQGGPGFLHVQMCAYTPQSAQHPTMVVHVASGGLAARVMGAARSRGEPVPDVPDAYFSVDARQATVVVLSGHTSVTIGSYGPNADRAILHRLAAVAATRLAEIPVSP